MKNNEIAIKQPKFLRLEPTNRCSANCIMCPNKQIVYIQGEHDLNPSVIPEELMRSIEDVIFLQNGEFTESRYLGDILDFIRRYPVRLHVTTNGMYLSHDLLKELLEMNLASITFSVDTVQPDLFNKIRRGCNLDKVLGALEYISKWKIFFKLFFPVIQANITVMRSNIEVLPETLLFLANMGVNLLKVDYVRIHRTSVENGSIKEDESLYFHQNISNRILTNCKYYLKEYSCELRLPPLFQSVCDLKLNNIVNRPIDKFCKQPLTDAIIWANGNLTPCTGAQNEVLGNLVNQSSFDSIWNGDRALAFREKYSSARPPQECQECVCLEDLGWAQGKEWHVF